MRPSTPPPPSTSSELEETPRTYQAVPESSDATPPAANQDDTTSDEPSAATSGMLQGQEADQQQPPAETQSEEEQSDQSMKDQSAQDQSAQDQSMQDQSAQGDKKTLPEGSAEAKLESQAKGPSGAEGTTWIDLDEVDFEVNSADVPENAKGQIENVAIVLKENPDVTIEIRGHASATGDDEQNKALSKQRAESVRQALVDQGIESSRISVTSDEKAVESRQGDRVSARIKSGEKDEG